jgi:class 3 adenylate cyclase
MQLIRTYWANLNLRSKITSLVSLLVTVTVLSLTFISIQRERANFQAELAEQTDLFIESVSIAIRDDLYSLRLDEILYISRAVSDNPNVTMFVVYDPDGRVLVDSRLNGPAFSNEVDPVGATLVRLPASSSYTDWQEEQFLMGRSIRLGNQTVGAVATGLSTLPLQTKISSITIQGLTLAFIVLAIGAGLTVLLSRQITNPLRELTDVVSRISQGDLNLRVNYKGRDEIGQLGAAFNEMAEQLQERAWLRDMFGRFVSHEVVDAIRMGQVRLEGENRTVSVLFCDIREFTDFSENHTPEEVVSLLNEFLPLVVHAAQRHNGMVNKFGGDSTLIIYGALNEIEDSAHRAVLTALEIRAAVKKLNQELVQKGEHPLRVGAGINTGVALAGAIGPEERQEYTVVGNTVNLAARIDGLNRQFPEHDILISGWTYHALEAHREKFEFVPLGTVPIRGKNEPVEIWAVK